MVHGSFDLLAAARRDMIQHGFDPDFPPGTDQQLADLKKRAEPAANADTRDLRGLLWSSIDNDTSRDLDQIEYAERVPNGIRVLVGIADVDADVLRGSPVDGYASAETTTVYTAVRNFPMLPEVLSTGLTSLAENEDRRAIVIEIVAAADGSIASSSIFPALLRNRAQLLPMTKQGRVWKAALHRARKSRRRPNCRRNLNCRTKRQAPCVRSGTGSEP